MKDRVSILMIDDHEPILEGYKTILKSKTTFKMKIAFAKDCDQAIHRIVKSKISNPYDVIFLDIQLPQSADGKYTSGEDLAFFIKEELPKTKIIVLTMFNEAYRLLNIISNIPCNAILVKSDVVGKTIVNALEKVLLGGEYFSKTVKIVKSQIIEYNEKLDENDRRILYFLNKGLSTKELPKHIELSLSAIEKRKRSMKQMLNVSNNSQLLEEAKKRGLL